MEVSCPDFLHIANGYRKVSELVDASQSGDFFKQKGMRKEDWRT